MRRTSLAIGGLLWLGATVLLLEDAWRSGHATVNHLMMPALTAGTVAAAVQLHHHVFHLRIVPALAFLLLACVGSVATVYGTLGRQAEARDVKIAGAETVNAALTLKREALASARRSLVDAEAEVVRDCRGGFGKTCAGWRTAADERRAEVRRVEAELSTMQSVPVDARADAVVRLATLLGARDEAWIRALVAALDPVLLPFFLELGSICFFAAGFPAKPMETVGDDEETVDGPWSEDDALADLLSMLRRNVSMDQTLLAARWSRSKGTVSRWMKGWMEEGLIGRQREGKRKLATQGM